MTNTPHNDPRADHKVHVYPHATNVKLYHRGYEISLAADGQETIIFDSEDNEVWRTTGTSALAVFHCVQFIDSLK